MIIDALELGLVEIRHRRERHIRINGGHGQVGKVEPFRVIGFGFGAW